MISDIHIWNGHLLYSFGGYQSNGLMYGFVSEIWLLNKDEEQKSLLPSIEPEVNIFPWDNEVFYNDFSASSEYPHGIFAIHADTLQRRQIGHEDDRLLNITNGNLYFTRGAGNPAYSKRDHLGLFRVRPNGTDLQRLGDGESQGG